MLVTLLCMTLVLIFVCYLFIFIFARKLFIFLVYGLKLITLKVIVIATKF
jgi:hypothetical protein